MARGEIGGEEIRGIIQYAARKARSEEQKRTAAAEDERDALRAENTRLRAALRDAERMGQLESREEPKITRCVFCTATGIPARGIKPRHGDGCPFAATPEAR